VARLYTRSKTGGPLGLHFPGSTHRPAQWAHATVPNGHSPMTLTVPSERSNPAANTSATNSGGPLGVARLYTRSKTSGPLGLHCWLYTQRGPCGNTVSLSVNPANETHWGLDADKTTAVLIRRRHWWTTWCGQTLHPVEDQRASWLTLLAQHTVPARQTTRVTVNDTTRRSAHKYRYRPIH
jgi:hypothetical protein